MRAVALSPAEGDMAIISHGGVGALLLCHLKDVPIARTEDQPGDGGGCFYSFDAASRRVLSATSLARTSAVKIFVSEQSRNKESWVGN